MVASAVRADRRAAKRERQAKCAILYVDGSHKEIKMLVVRCSSCSAVGEDSELFPFICCLKVAVMEHSRTGIYNSWVSGRVLRGIEAFI